MHETLPPLLGRLERVLLVLRVTGKAALDLSPVKGATMLAWAGAGLAVEATAAVETIIEDAIFLLFYLIIELLLLPIPLYKPIPPFCNQT